MDNFAPSLTVVGDVFLDVDVYTGCERASPDAGAPILDEHTTNYRPGGAGLSALLAAHSGWNVRLVCALGADSAGALVTSMLCAAGVLIEDLGLEGRTPEKIRIFRDGTALARLDRGGKPKATLKKEPRLDFTDPLLVSDYGRGITSLSGIRRQIANAPLVVWDPHPRGAPPVGGVAVATPNEVEAVALAGGRGHADLRGLARKWGAPLCVTRGASGAALFDGAGEVTAFVTPAAEVVDVCGAGDCFSVSLATGLASGLDLPHAVADAVASATVYVGTPAPNVRAAATGAPDDRTPWGWGA